MDINGKHALVTGGGTGIGLAIARNLKDAGARVTIAGRRKEVLATVAAEHGFDTVALDVTDGKSVAKAVKGLADLDILVNNAGRMQQVHVTDDDAQAVAEAEFDTNVFGTMRLTHAALPTLRERGGAVVNVTSGLAYVPWPAAPSYCASKAALHSWTKSIRSQLKGTGVSVFEVLPPLTKTAMVSDVEIGMKKADPDTIGRDLVVALAKDRYEVPVGASKQLRFMSRVAPNFIEGQLAK